MNEQCIYCHSTLGTGDISGVCYSCREKQKENTVDFALYNIYKTLGTPEQIRKALAERDAAVRDMKQMHRCGINCGFCKHQRMCTEKFKRVGSCSDFEWRGLIKDI
jgi:hypothetical protein